jgi:hypothetical protein
MRVNHCGQCRATVFFENDSCLSCAAALGFAPASGGMLSFLPPDAAPGTAWQRHDGGPPLQPCANRHSAARCNWMIDDGDAAAPGGQALCRSCRLTQVLPALDTPANGLRWQLIEQAKRRLLYGLLDLGLAPSPKQGPEDTMGLAFHLLQDQPGQPPVKTGHDNGTITLNVAEADDDHREAQRVRLGEPARTLLGHLRHETAHYLQYRWIDNTPAAELCRATFGDERSDYAQALARHYEQGPPADWAQRYISAYASAHPWEDWAETCAHYLLALDAVQTAAAWGLQLSGATPAAPQVADPGQACGVEQLVVQQWLPVAQFLNAMNRSLGRRDSYSFQVPPEVLRKMAVVQQLLQTAAQGGPVQTGASTAADAVSNPA